MRERLGNLLLDSKGFHSSLFNRATGFLLGTTYALFLDSVHYYQAHNSESAVQVMFGLGMTSAVTWGLEKRRSYLVDQYINVHR